MINNKGNEIVHCEYNAETDSVEIVYDKIHLSLNCTEIESELLLTPHTEMVLHKMLEENPIEYAAMTLSKELQCFCDIEAKRAKSIFDVIVQGYLKQGYCIAMAEALAREFMMYES